MTKPGAPDENTSSAGPRRIGGHYRGFLALLIALVVGAVAGGVVVAVFSGDDQVVVRTPSSASASAGSPTQHVTGSSGRSPSGSANVQLSSACVRVVNDAQDAYTALGGLENAVKTLNATKLDNIIRQVQQVRRHLAADLPKCHAGIELPSGSPSPMPSTTG